MNDSGRVAFVTPRLGTPGGSADNSALYSIRDAGLFWVHARRGDTPPFTSTTFNGLFPPTINDQPPAAVAFFTSHGSGSAPVTVYTSRLGVLSPVAWLSRLAPDASDGDGINGSLSIFSYAGTGDPPALRPNASEIMFYSHMSGTTNGLDRRRRRVPRVARRVSRTSRAAISRARAVAPTRSSRRRPCTTPTASPRSSRGSSRCRARVR